MAAGSVIPQGYASPYIINLIFSDSLLVAAGTERSLSGVDVRIRGAPHRCIGMARRKPETRSVGWSPNYIREEHARQAWKTLQELPGSPAVWREELSGLFDVGVDL